MQLKPIDICVIQETVNGSSTKEYLHEMSDFRVHELKTRRSRSGKLYYQKDIRDIASKEIDRRLHNSLVTRARAEVEFSYEVIAAMIDAGMSLRVAESLTSEESKLMQQASRFGIV